jgi:hypothetical protein
VGSTCFCNYLKIAAINAFTLEITPTSSDAKVYLAFASFAFIEKYVGYFRLVFAYNCRDTWLDDACLFAGYFAGYRPACSCGPSQYW